MQYERTAASSTPRGAMHWIRVALLILALPVALWGIVARLFAAFTPLWLDIATIVSIPVVIVVLYVVGRSPPG
jgi:hypothetical protein